MDGWIKLHRKVLENPVVCKDAEYLAVWIYLLLNATHDDHPALFRGEKITLHAGQLITGRKKISEYLGVNESKVKRILQAFKTDQQIDQQTSNKNSLISILNWGEYQKSDQQNDRQMTSKRPTNDQQMTTNKKERTKEQENLKDNMSPEYPYKDVIAYLNQRAGTAFRDSSKDSKKHIVARFVEGFTLDDFKAVVDKKVSEWSNDPDMSKYIRPSTLFGPKFEGYLNQPAVKPGRNQKNQFNNFEQRDYDYEDLERQLLASQSREEKKND